MGVAVQVMMQGLTVSVMEVVARLVPLELKRSREAVSVVAARGLRMFRSDSPRVRNADEMLLGKKLLILTALAVGGASVTAERV